MESGAVAATWEDRRGGRRTKACENVSARRGDGDLHDQGATSDAWREVGIWVEQRRRLAGTESDLLERVRGLDPEQEALALIDAVGDLIKQETVDLANL